MRSYCYSQIPIMYRANLKHPQVDLRLDSVPASSGSGSGKFVVPAPVPVKFTVPVEPWYVSCMYVMYVCILCISGFLCAGACAQGVFK